MKDEPLISVIIPTYNRAHTVIKAIKSVLEQSWIKKEIIIVDDGSTDNTEEIIQPYLSKVKYVKQQNQGVSAARNKGIEISSGEYITFLDSDDIWLETKIEHQVNDLINYPECILHLTNALVDRPNINANIFNLFEQRGFKSKENLIEYRPLQILLKYDLAMVQCCMVKKKLLSECKFDTNYRIHEDLDFFLRLSLMGPWYISRKPLVHICRYLVDSNNLSSLNRTDTLKGKKNLIVMHENIESNLNLKNNERKIIRKKLSVYLRSYGNSLYKHGYFNDSHIAYFKSLKKTLHIKPLIFLIILLFKKTPLQKNLWVVSGKGNSPSL
jgi:glycosyltransferase involved in cell wall biosynthesis